MNDPIKVIYKCKNNNRRIQYHLYIYVGFLVPNNIKKIFDKIKSLNLFDTLIKLTSEEYKIMENKYGEYWYLLFFITDHIDMILSNQEYEYVDDLKKLFSNSY